MNVTLHRPDFARTLAAPTSKSAAHRALIAAAFADRATDISLSGAGEDIAATVRCLGALGARITAFDAATGRENAGADASTGRLHVLPATAPAASVVLDCGESGSTLRFLLPVAAALGVSARFLRRGRLPERPIEPLAGEMTRHGARISALPDGSLTLAGRLVRGDYTIAADVSSQFVTGLLYALSLLDGDSTLTLTGEIESAPYIDMTLRALADFGACPERGGTGRVFRIAGHTACPLRSPGALAPEGDFSGAAFPLAAGALGAHPVTVSGLLPDTAQGDSAILSLLARFGAGTAVEGNRVTVSPARLHGIDIDARQIPDLVPILATVAAGAAGCTRITGASRLRLKESDRIAATAAMLRALGGEVCELPDGLAVTGGRPLAGGVVDGAGDHRIVMSAAVAALLCENPVTITGAEAVAKSYPLFFTDALART